MTIRIQAKKNTVKVIDRVDSLLIIDSHVLRLFCTVEILEQIKNGRIYY